MHRKSHDAPRHDYLENTIRSIRRAFELGAHVVEFDVQSTADERFAVLHDASLECRTNGRGETRAHSLGELQQLDIGFGYTTDGETFPFRGKGVGALPSLAEVLAAFPTQRLLINVKRDERAEGDRLVAVLGALPPERRPLLAVYGGHAAVLRVRERLPEIRTLSGPLLEQCLTRYAALGWSGYVPAPCTRAVLFIPVNLGPWLWGWPNRLLSRMNAAGTEVYAVNRYAGEGFTSGLDSSADLRQLPPNYRGGVSTDRIDALRPPTGPR